VAIELQASRTLKSAPHFDRHDVVIARSPKGDVAIQGNSRRPCGPWIAASP
jgi:hypothetical protein